MTNRRKVLTDIFDLDICYAKALGFSWTHWVKVHGLAGRIGAVNFLSEEIVREVGPPAIPAVFPRAVMSHELVFKDWEDALAEP